MKTNLPRPRPLFAIALQEYAALLANPTEFLLVLYSHHYVPSEMCDTEARGVWKRLIRCFKASGITDRDLMRHAGLRWNEIYAKELAPPPSVCSNALEVLTTLLEERLMTTKTKGSP